MLTDLKQAIFSAGHITRLEHRHILYSNTYQNVLLGIVLWFHLTVLTDFTAPCHYIATSSSLCYKISPSSNICTIMQLKALL